MSCRTGPADRPSVEHTLAGLGWCPDHQEDSAYLRDRRAEMTARLPESVRPELLINDPVLITTFPNVWGFASFGRREALVLCLFSDDLAVLQQQCAHAVSALPQALESLGPGHRCVFDPHVEVRRFDENALVARGVISTTAQVRFSRYIWATRRRERVVLLALLGLCTLSMGTALALYLWCTGEGWAYVRGYADRLSSAVQTAIVIMLINLIFEYQDWRHTKAVIEWSGPS